MARTKGGLNTKLHAAVDGRSQPQALILTAGTEADVVYAPALLESVDARHVLMDKADDSDALWEFIARKGMNLAARSSWDKPAFFRYLRIFGPKMFRKRWLMFSPLGTRLRLGSR